MEEKMLSRGRRWVEKTSEKKRSPSVEDLLPGQVVLKCVRINFIYWPQNPNRRPSAPCSGLTVSAGVSCSWALGLAYWIFIYSLPLCLWHLTESWVLNLGLGVSYFYYGKFFFSFFYSIFSYFFSTASSDRHLMSLHLLYNLVAYFQLRASSCNCPWPPSKVG